MSNIIIENKPKYYCETCKYGCDHNNTYRKHLNSELHSRAGEKKIFKCDKCDYTTTTSKWNLKIHYVSNHSTVEEKLKQKYYCVACDSVFFSPLYLNNHNKSISHINRTMLNNNLNNIMNNTLNNTINNIIDVVDISNNNLDITINNDLKTEIKNELKAELKAELKREIMLEIKTKLLELF
jgi:hypothetical protein